MTTSEPKTAEFTKNAENTAAVITEDKCAACSHPWEKHDALGVRYCTATTASSLSRGCICG
jgi:hypothetical protein